MKEQRFYDTPSETHPSENMPGCGIASYGCLLLVFFVLGIVGLVVSSMSLVQTSLSRPPFSFVSGRQVEVWRLQPMRDAGLLQLTEIPEWYHDESSDGTQACALQPDALLRVHNGDAWRVPYSDMIISKSIRDQDIMVGIVELQGGDSIHCLFAPGEGVERFTREVNKRIQEHTATETNTDTEKYRTPEETTP